MVVYFYIDWNGPKAALTAELPMPMRLSRQTCTAMPPLSLMDMMEDQVQRTIRISDKVELWFWKKVNISDTTTFVGRKEDFLSNYMNKQALIHLISEHLQQKGPHMIQAKGDADLDRVKVSVAMTSYNSTTLIRENTDLLVLLLHHATIPAIPRGAQFCIVKGYAS